MKIKNNTLIVDIDGEIGDFWGISYKEIKKGIESRRGKFDRVQVVINSPGGSVTEGMAIRNAFAKLSEEGVPVDVEVMGVAASIASVIALSGDSLTMRPGSFMMIHRPYTVAVVDYEEAENLATTLKKMNDEILGVYRDRSSLSDEEIAEYMDRETWFTASEAVDYGFAGSVADVPVNEIINSARIVPHRGAIWQAFKNTPEELRTIEDAQEQQKEVYMNLNEAIEAHPAIADEVAAKVDEAKAQSDEAVKAEQARILSLLDLSGAKIDEPVKAAIESGQSEAELALAMVRAGLSKEPKAAAAPAPVAAAQIPPVAVVEPVEDPDAVQAKKLDDMLDNIFKK